MWSDASDKAFHELKTEVNITPSELFLMVPVISLFILMPLILGGDAYYTTPKGGNL